MIKMILSPNAYRYKAESSGKEYIEVIEIQAENGYPLGIAHIDAFHKPDDLTLYDRLAAGETITVSLEIIEEEETE